jgi:hypothetical protein
MCIDFLSNFRQIALLFLSGALFRDLGVSVTLIQLRERLLRTLGWLRSTPKAPNNGILRIESGNFCAVD